MQSNLGKYKDSTPEIRPAGKLFEQGGTAEECIHGRGTEVIILFLCSNELKFLILFLLVITSIGNNIFKSNS